MAMASLTSSFECYPFGAKSEPVQGDLLTDYIGRLGQMSSPINLGDYRFSRSLEIESILKKKVYASSTFPDYLKAYYYACTLEKSDQKLQPNVWRQSAALLKEMGSFNKGKYFLAITFLNMLKTKRDLSNLMSKDGFSCRTFQSSLVKEWKTRDILRLLHLRPFEGESKSITACINYVLRGTESNSLPGVVSMLSTLKDASTPAGLVSKLIETIPGLTWKNINSRTRFNLDVYSALLAVRGISSTRIIKDFPRLEAKGIFKDELFVEQICRELKDSTKISPIAYQLAALNTNLPEQIRTALQIPPKFGPLRNLADATIIIETPMGARTFNKALILALTLENLGAKEVRIGNKPLKLKVESFVELIKTVEDSKLDPYKNFKIKGKIIYLSSTLRAQKPTGGQSMRIAIPQIQQNELKNQPPTHLDVIGLDARVWSLVDYWLGNSK